MPLLALLTCAGTVHGETDLLSPQVRSGDPVRELLEIMERVAGLYRDSALEFVADEQIRQIRLATSGRRPDRQAVYRLVYFYIAEDSPTGPRLADYRTREDDPDASRIDLAGLDLRGYVLRPFSWVFVFLPENQSLFRFALEEPRRIDDKLAQVVRFEPRGGPYRQGVNDAFGRIWIDARTWAPLRIEAFRSDEITSMLEKGPRDPEADDVAYESHHIRVDWGVEKNGLRFPSEAALTIGWRALPELSDAGFRRLARDVLEEGLDGRFRVIHRFSDYRFFSILTRSELRGRVTGEQPR